MRMPKSGFRSENHEMIEEINKSQNYYWSIIKVESGKAKRGKQRKVFPPCLVPCPRTHQPAVRQLRLSQDPSHRPCPTGPSL